MDVSMSGRVVVEQWCGCGVTAAGDIKVSGDGRTLNSTHTHELNVVEGSGLGW